jgi:hypothetical protein
LLLLLLEKLLLLLCRRRYFDTPATVDVVDVLPGADSCLFVPVVAAATATLIIPAYV